MNGLENWEREKMALAAVEKLQEKRDKLEAQLEKDLTELDAAYMKARGVYPGYEGAIEKMHFEKRCELQQAAGELFEYIDKHIAMFLDGIGNKA